METLARTANRGSVSTGPYEIDNSLLLDNSDSSMEYNHHQMSPGGDDQWSAQSNAGTNSKKATISLWIKRAKLSPSSGAGQYARLFQFQTGGNATSLYFVTDQLTMYDDVTSASLKTNRKFRDTSAWYHIVLAMDSTQSTAADRVKLYVNGVQETSWATEDYGNQNSDLAMFSTTNVVFYLGTASGNGQGYAFDGYITEFHFVDGAQKAASDFGEYDEDSGIWKPKQYTGSYGTLGCYYNFEDTSSNRFNDESGNGNYMDNRGGSFEGEITTDTPTNNFCTWVSDGTLFNSGTDNETFSHGGTRILTRAGTGWTAVYPTQSFAGGKWYMEVKVNETSATNMYGAMPVKRINSLKYQEYYHGQDVDGSIGLYANNGQIYWGTASSGGSGSALSAGDIVGLAIDMENYKMYFAVNNTYVESGNPAGNSNGRDIEQEPYVFSVAHYTTTTVEDTNFGGYTAMSNTHTNTDDNGYGSFVYAPPSGFLAVCTKNLAENGG